MFRNLIPAAKAVLLASTACLMLAAPVAAQTMQTAAVASVRGRVVDSAGDYLAAARVRVPALGIVTTTDREGLFSLALPAGSHDLLIDYPGRDQRRVSVTAPQSALQTVVLTTGGNAEVSELVVTASPIVSSQAAAIAQQRAAENIVSIVAADAIGRFPDQSAAAALSRVPGVAIERDQGQERYVQLRGAPERWTVVAVDGMNVLGAEERVFRFDSVPAVVIQSLEVNKTLTPDQPAEALAGRINIVTSSAFDRPGLHVSGDLGYGEMALGGGPQRQFSGQISWSGEHFGVTAALAHYRRNQTTDNREINWLRDGSSDTPDDFSFRSYSLERENNAGHFGVEYRPDRGGRIFLDSLYSEFIDREQRNQYDFQLSRALSQSPANRGADSGFVDGAGYTASFEYGRYYDDTFANTIGGDHPDVMGFDVSWRGNYTHTDAGAYLPLIQQNFLLPTGRLSLIYNNATSGIPDLRLFRSVPGAPFTRGAALDALPQTGSAADVFIPIVYETNTDSWTGQVDIRRDWMSMGAEAEFKAGVKLDRRKATGNTFSGLPGAIPNLTGLAAQLATPWSVTPRITSGRWRSDFQRGWAVNEVDNIGLRADVDAFLASAQAAGLFDPTKAIQPQDRFSVREDIWSAYGQNKWSSGPWEVLAGLRIESVKVKSSGVLAAGTTLTPLTVDADYADVFPSIHVNYDVTDDIKARLALIRGIARPSFGEIRTSVSVNDVSETISGGNPTLEPERAWGLDGALEWYLPGAGLASVSAFYRKVDDVIFDATTIVRDDTYDTTGFDRTGYEFTTTLNGSDGKMAGVEFAYLQQWDFLPAPLDGLGFQGNLTFLDGDFKTPNGTTSKYPGLSDTILNASIFYEKHGFSARISYQWRDAWLDEPSVDATDETYWAATEQLDLSLRYQVRKGVTVYFDANNLTDEIGQRYQGRESRPIETEGTGRRFMGGVRFNF